MPEFEFQETAGGKFGCILEIDTVDFTPSSIVLDTADFATGFFLRKEYVRYSLKLELSRTGSTVSYVVWLHVMG